MSWNKKRFKISPKQSKNCILPECKSIAQGVQIDCSLYEMQFLLKIASCNRLHLSANRLLTVKNRKTAFQMRKSLIKLYIKHLMIIDSIEHENSIKMWENRTNGITKWCSMNHTTKINKRLHHERCRSHLPKVDL